MQNQNNIDAEMYKVIVSLLVRLKEENIDLQDFYTNLETNESYMKIIEPYFEIGMSEEDKNQLIQSIKIAVQTANETLKMFKGI